MFVLLHQMFLYTLGKRGGTDRPTKKMNFIHISILLYPFLLRVLRQYPILCLVFTGYHHLSFLLACVMAWSAGSITYYRIDT